MTPSRAPLRFLGTWRVTQCESSRPDLPFPKSGIASFTQEGEAVYYENETTWSDGRFSRVTALLRLDGSWCSVTGSALADSASLQSNGDSFSVQMQNQGKEAGTNRTTVSSSGRTMVSSWELPTPDGDKMVWKVTSERE